MLKFYEVDGSDNKLSNAIQSVVDTQFNDYRDLLLAKMKNTTVKTICDKILKQL